MMAETGSVSRWNDEKGFGFIVKHGSQDSIYVHRTGLAGIETLHEGDNVEYERAQDAIDVKRGKERAVNVRPMGSGDGLPGGFGGPDGMGLGQVPVATAPGPGLPGGLPGPGLDQGMGLAARETGTVKGWNDEKRYGFVAPDAGGECIYVHCTGLVGTEFVREGDIVEFERFQDAHDMRRGKERATNVRVLSDTTGRSSSSAAFGRPAGMAGSGGVQGGLSATATSGGAGTANPPPGSGPLEAGKVSRWNDEKGFGFIVCDLSQDSIYVHRTGLANCETLTEGDEVEYERFQDTRDMERGKERAVNVKLVNSFGGTMPSGLQGGMQQGGMGMQQGGLQHGIHGGMGMQQGMQGVQQGMQHGFGVQQGQGMGQGLQGQQGQQSFAPIRLGQNPGMQGSQGAQALRERLQRSAPYQRAPLQAFQGAPREAQSEVGTCMSWNDEKGFGFILLNDSKESIYVHRTGFNGLDTLREGDAVQFERFQDARDLERGKERAVNVRLLGAPQGQPLGQPPGQGPGQGPGLQGLQGLHGQGLQGHGQAGQPLQPLQAPRGRQDLRLTPPAPAPDSFAVGTVTNWNDEKGFGFIVRQDGQESIYVHRTGLAGVETLHEGDVVEYGKTQDARDMERGKERAVSVRLISSSVQGMQEMPQVQEMPGQGLLR